MREGDFGCVLLDKLTLPSSNSTTSKGKEIFYYVAAAFLKTDVASQIQAFERLKIYYFNSHPLRHREITQEYMWSGLTPNDIRKIYFAYIPDSADLRSKKKEAFDCAVKTQAQN